jgi:hypothetical protein
MNRRKNLWEQENQRPKQNSQNRFRLPMYIAMPQGGIP